MIDGRSYLSEVFGLAFGVNSPVFCSYNVNLDKLIFKDNDPYKLPEAKKQEEIVYQNVRVKESEQIDSLSWMGTPIVYPFTLKEEHIKSFSDGELKDFRLDDFQMPAATLIDFSRTKIITKTPVLGSNGSVKNSTLSDDWKIRIRGVCLDDNTRSVAKTAIEQKEELLKWEQVCGSINIVGSLFFEKNILALTINNTNFTQLEAKPNMIPFEFECESDERLELIL